MGVSWFYKEVSDEMKALTRDQIEGAALIGECLPSAIRPGVDRVGSERVCRTCSRCGVPWFVPDGFTPRKRDEDGLVTGYYRICNCCRANESRKPGAKRRSAARGKAMKDRVGESGLLERCCRACGDWKVRTGNFSPRRRRKGGGVALWASHCNLCVRADQNRRYADQPEEKRKADQRASYQRVRADPERLDAFRETNRLSAARRRRRDPEGARRIVERYQRRLRVNPDRRAERAETDRFSHRERAERAGRAPQSRPREITERGEALPIGPFREWLEEILVVQEDDMKRTARFLKTDARRVHAWRYDNEAIPFSIADEAFVAAGEPYRMAELYPAPDMPDRGRELMRWEPGDLLREDLEAFGPGVFAAIERDLGIGRGAVRAAVRQGRLLRVNADRYRESAARVMGEAAEQAA